MQFMFIAYEAQDLRVSAITIKNFYFKIKRISHKGMDEQDFNTKHNMLYII